MRTEEQLAEQPRDELGDVLLFDELDADDVPILRWALLPAGDRAQARRWLVLDVVRGKTESWVVCLVDLYDLPQHMVLVWADTLDDKATVSEAYQHHDSPQGQAILSNLRSQGYI